jgi:hypothetical protein
MYDSEIERIQHQARKGFTVCILRSITLSSLLSVE